MMRLFKTIRRWPASYGSSSHRYQRSESCRDYHTTSVGDGRVRYRSASLSSLAYATRSPVSLSAAAYQHYNSESYPEG